MKMCGNDLSMAVVRLSAKLFIALVAVQYKIYRTAILESDWSIQISHGAIIHACLMI